MRSPRRVYVGVLRRAARLAGYRLAVAEPPPEDVRRHLMLDADRVAVVVDVGANIGQYGQALRRTGWSGHIVSFEPQSKPYAALLNVATRDGNWEAHRLALGAEGGTISINIASIHPRSSILPISDEHRKLLPDSSYVGSEEVACDRLDNVLDNTPYLAAGLALKLDVQGYEMEVLRGAELTLRAARLIELELSLVNMYDGQPTAAEVIRFLDDRDFELVSAEAENIDRVTGRMNWLNVVFRRQDAASARQS